MARHLTSDELIDLAEGTRAEDAVPHLLTCETCRQQLADLRATLSAVADVEEPEPSPLFWDHFSARVREAMAAELAPRRTGIVGAWSMRVAVPVSMLVGAVLAIGVLRGGGFGGSNVPAGIPSTVAATHAVEPAVAGEAGDDLPLGLVADLLDDLELDADVVNDAGLSVQTGTTDHAVAGLTDDERSELERLLRDELTRPGA